MKCPYCGNEDTKVIDSRPFSDGNSIKRRRKCDNCNNRFNTTEKIFKLPIQVKKKDGRIEEFNRNKIFQGLLRSLVKRDIDETKLEDMLDNVEREVLNRFNGRIQSQELGSIIMENLLEIDEVAYIRFASVYKKFDSLDSFIEIIRDIKKKKKERKK